MIDLETARSLLDFGSRIGGGPRAEEQLIGAVAIHNILCKHKLAYLADEVGMGKTYVALGALALFRHFDPSFRVLVIAPRENIQSKWQKELSNFAANNVRFADLRVRSLDGRPARPLVSCGDLLDLVNEVSLDPTRDFFIRMPSFSMMLGKNPEDWKRKRNELRKCLPWLEDAAFDLRNKDLFKKNFARAVCCALPPFDLVIVDEAHNLKHGLGSSSARNQVLAEVFGRHCDGDEPDAKLFPGYGPRAKRVLFLSATPLEESYRHIWNQLDLFGMADGFNELKSDVSDSRKKEVAAQFLIRRVTSIRISENEYTKNMYRREWRAGGVQTHDEPIRIQDERQRLIVALVQKKVFELLGSTKFKRSFQIGMLASFESFLQTTRTKRDDEENLPFDDAEQTDVAAERDGLDVRDVNRLASDYWQTFRRAMPHPKMDALVDGLSSSWSSGRKALVFVRRVASVGEIKRKLDERYDDWLIPMLRDRLPQAVRRELDELVERYLGDKPRSANAQTAPASEDWPSEPKLDDRGGHDTFFAWFFRGEGPSGWVSGATIQGRFIQPSSAYSTFFADNYVMALLDAPAGQVADALAAALDMTRPALVDALQRRAIRYLPRTNIERANRMEAAQASALELLADHKGCPYAVRARVIWEERFQASILAESAKAMPGELARFLEEETFFTKLRSPERAALRAQIWPSRGAVSDDDSFRVRFREEVLRAQLLSSAARLGHASIDLYVAALAGRTTLATHRNDRAAQDGRGQDDSGSATRLLHEYLGLLEEQSMDPSAAWGALSELGEIAAHFDLILDVNAPDIRTAPLQEAARLIAGLLRQQRPVGGMAGKVNRTLVRQFRMPGYPLVLITTDVLQEGEDLHTFCSAIHHYGISWTPSAMEQRIGRIDRVRSQTDRRLSTLEREPLGEDWLQVYFPHLEDTVEVLQVERVLNGMNRFLRLMHEELTSTDHEQSKVDVSREMLRTRRPVEAILKPLKSSFPVPAWAAKVDKRTTLAVAPGIEAELRSRFAALKLGVLGGLVIEWTHHSPKGQLVGTAKLPSGRGQPFVLLLRSDHGHLVVRCVSPIGRTDPLSDPDSIASRAASLKARIGAILTREDRTYDLTVEEDVLLGSRESDAKRVGILIRHVCEQADRMEHDYFPDRRDAPLTEFERDLKREGDNGN